MNREVPVPVLNGDQREQPDDRVHTQEDGALIHPDGFRRHFLRRVAATGLPPSRPHALRHAYATMLLARGVPTKVLSERLGHADAAITMAEFGASLQAPTNDLDDDHARTTLARCWRGLRKRRSPAAGTGLTYAFPPVRWGVGGET